ncbi:hypothetical protein BDV28DRAFT_128629 [Aspergillus coremiiformis]|uniref:Uncharacterized protein n=1 Tax=Aspergillus coremiiformis TaxID=138285 RepID=A0A5N6ZDI0_9EURO|nr:hypothetical protein BDV28DRAFT_128629 [Aspergillus coremiiformis]
MGTRSLGCRALSSRYSLTTDTILGSLTRHLLVRVEHRQVMCGIRDAFIASVK